MRRRVSTQLNPKQELSIEVNTDRDQVSLGITYPRPGKKGTETLYGWADVRKARLIAKWILKNTEEE
jgi:hypothetical protein